MHYHKNIRKVHQAFRARPACNDPSLNESTLGPSTPNPEVSNPIKTLETDFRELADGTLVEMIQDPDDTTKSLLAVSKNGQAHLAEKWKFGNQVLLPLPRNTAITRHLRLANGIGSLESAENLILQIMHFLSFTVELSPPQLVVLSCFVVCTWLIEKLPFAPYVAFVGPPGSGKTTALRVLNLLCRRPLLTSDISTSAFYEICDRMIPTVLIDETATVDNCRKLFHILRTGTSHDFVAFRKNRTFKLYGARAISWLEPPNDAALNSRCLLISMASCKRTDLLPPNDALVLRMAETLQRKLLHFRLANFQTLKLPKVGDEEQLQPRTRDLFRALSMPLGDYKEAQEVLLYFLKGQESLRELLSVNQTAVLESLSNTIHNFPGLDDVRLAFVAKCVNAKLESMGESGNLSARKIGDLLTSLHLTNRQRTNVGYILWLDRDTRKKFIQWPTLTRLMMELLLTSPSAVKCVKA